MLISESLCMASSRFTTATLRQRSSYPSTCMTSTGMATSLVRTSVWSSRTFPSATRQQAGLPKKAPSHKEVEHKTFSWIESRLKRRSAYWSPMSLETSKGSTMRTTWKSIRSSHPRCSWVSWPCCKQIYHAVRITTDTRTTTRSTSTPTMTKSKSKEWLRPSRVQD